MSKSFIAILLILSVVSSLRSQEKLEIEGAIIIGNSEDPEPQEGTIRYSQLTKDFYGWNGKNWLSLTRFSQSGPSVWDADGNLYKSVRLGSQIWMADNLRTSVYNDTTPIPQVTSDTEWENLTSGAWCWYANDANYEIPYGKLYNWHAVGTGKLCPDGWHVPTESDWTTLIAHVGMGEPQLAGGTMKDVGLTFWNSPNAGATNSSALFAVPGGARTSQGTFGWLGDQSFWWGAIDVSNMYSRTRVLVYNGTGFSTNVFLKTVGSSVRCVKD